jgi:hypothetical protein
LAWQEILKEHIDKPIWSDKDLYSLLAFKPPKFSIKHAYDIIIQQLLACCLLGVQTANTSLSLHGYSYIHKEIYDYINKQIQIAIVKNYYIGSLLA